MELARRMIAASPDRELEAQLVTALQVLGPVDGHRTMYSLGPGELDAQLCVIHLDGEFADAATSIIPRLVGDCRVIVVLARAALASLVDLMAESERVVGVVIVEDLDFHQLAAMAARILNEELFGVARLVKPGTEIHAEVVGDYQDKARCAARLAQFAEQANVPRKHHEAIEQCFDEMMMNAMYDAPVDDQGRHLFAGIPTKTRVSMRIDQTVSVQFACDDTRFAMSVRDQFGSLHRATLIGVLRKCFHATDQIDRKASGAGVGLFLMLNATSTLYFNVVPGVTTEVACTFSLDAGQAHLQQFGFFAGLADEVGNAVGAPARNLRAVAVPGATGGTRHAMVAVLSLAIAAIVLVGFFAWRRSTRGPSPTIDAPVVIPVKPVATVELDSVPTGAEASIGGKSIGGTPLALTELVPGTEVAITLKRLGFRDTVVQLKVPALGETVRRVERLHASEDFVRVHFVSDPPGAQVIQLGEADAADRTYTPADVVVPAGTLQRFMLTMPNHVPVVIAPFTPPRGTGPIEKSGHLVEGATLRLEATPATTVTIANAPHCIELKLPAECILAPGNYELTFTPAGKKPAKKRVTIAAEDQTVKLD